MSVFGVKIRSPLWGMTFWTPFSSSENHSIPWGLEARGCVLSIGVTIISNCDFCTPPSHRVGRPPPHHALCPPPETASGRVVSGRSACFLQWAQMMMLRGPARQVSSGGGVFKVRAGLERWAAWARAPTLLRSGLGCAVRASGGSARGGKRPAPGTSPRDLSLGQVSGSTLWRA